MIDMDRFKIVTLIFLLMSVCCLGLPMEDLKAIEKKQIYVIDRFRRPGYFGRGRYRDRYRDRYGIYPVPIYTVPVYEDYDRY